MTVQFEVVTDIAQSRERCFDLSCDIDAHLGSMKDSGERAIAGRSRRGGFVTIPPDGTATLQAVKRA